MDPHQKRRRRARPIVVLAIGTALIAVVLPILPAAATAPSRPFGSHPVSYAAGSVLPSNQSARDAATGAFYDQWKSRYLQAGCGAGRYFVNTLGDTSGRVVSEGQGYGMEIIPLMAGYDPAAQAEFDGLFFYAKDHPSSFSPDLMAWNQNSSCDNVGGDDSATDGDLSIAFGLLLADRQWGSAGSVDYLSEANKRIAAIKAWEINATTKLPNLGDWARDSNKYRFGTRPSDYMIDHFRAFQTATGDPFWGQVVMAIENIVEKMQSKYSPRTGLLPDFIVDTNGTPEPAPGNFLESRNDGKYSWNSCRTPWHLATDFLVSGDARSRTAALKISTWIKNKTGGKPGAIRSGYTLNGAVLNNVWYELAFAAPFAVGASVDSSQQTWLNALWNNILGKSASSDRYYGNSLKLQAMMALSNNYWLP